MAQQRQFDPCHADEPQPDWPHACSLAALLPHAGDVILLDQILHADHTSLTATLIVRDDGPFHNTEGTLPPWIGLEIMAQAVAAWAGLQAKAAGEPILLGFLVGTRQYNCSVAAFLPGQRLSVHVEQSLRDDNGLGVFACSLSAKEMAPPSTDRKTFDVAHAPVNVDPVLPSSAHRLLAEARLTVYRPPATQDFLKEPKPAL